MTAALLRTWDTEGYDFLCRGCAFKDGVYDFAAALRRCEHTL